MNDGHIRGSDICRAIDSAAKRTRSRVVALQAAGAQLAREIQDDLRRRAETIENLAEHYLPKLDRNTLAQTFAEVRGKLSDLLAQKESREEEIATRMDAVHEARRQAEGDLDRVTTELDRLVEQREALEKQLAATLAADGEFQRLSAIALEAERQLQGDEARVADAKSESAAKLPAYEGSRLFQYLVRRKYGSPAYEGRGLTRRLDNWVARLVDWPRARASYDFLRVTPELMEAEVDRRRTEFAAKMQDVEEVERRHSDTIGLTAALAEGVRVGQERDRLVAQLEAERQRQDALEAERVELSHHDNPYYRQAVDDLEALLASVNESALEAHARTTPEPTDDRLVQQISQLNAKLEESNRRGIESVGETKKLTQVVAGLTELVSRVRSHEFDSARSLFEPGFDMDRLLEAFMQGELDLEAVWSRLSANQQFAPHWVEEQYQRGADVMQSEFAYVMMRLLAEAAGAAIRHASQGGFEGGGGHRGGGGWSANRGGGWSPPRPSLPQRAPSPPPSVRRPAGGGFTNGRGF